MLKSLVPGRQLTRQLTAYRDSFSAREIRELMSMELVLHSDMNLIMYPLPALAINPASDL